MPRYTPPTGSSPRRSRRATCSGDLSAGGSVALLGALERSSTCSRADQPARRDRIDIDPVDPAGHREAAELERVESSAPGGAAGNGGAARPRSAGRTRAGGAARGAAPRPRANPVAATARRRHRRQRARAAPVRSPSCSGTTPSVPSSAGRRSKKRLRALCIALPASRASTLRSTSRGRSTRSTNQRCEQSVNTSSSDAPNVRRAANSARTAGSSMRVPRANAPRARAIRRDQPGTVAAIRRASSASAPASAARARSRSRSEGASTSWCVRSRRPKRSTGGQPSPRASRTSSQKGDASRGRPLSSTARRTSVA